METVVITGANRGIGLEMSRQSLDAGARVFATCRTPSNAAALDKLVAQYGANKLAVVALDVASDESVAAAQAQIAAATDQVDLLINNAGINLRDSFESFTGDAMLETLNINAVGAMRVATQFIGLLRAGSRPRLVNISSQLGSLQAARPHFGSYMYNSSKAAMNMITRHLSFDLAADGIIVVSMHPGWVQTDMGGSNAAVTVPDSAAGILNVARGLQAADNGKFYIYTGEEHPW